LDLIENIHLLLNPAASLPRNLSYGSADPVYFDKAVGAPDKSWLLAHLSVDPKYHKKGIGLLLAQTVLQRAEKERLPVILYSAPEGKKLYLKAGFRDIGTWQWAEGENRTFSVRRWDPPDEEMS